MSLNILVADSSSDHSLLLAQFLMNSGHQVETCSNGLEAYRAIQQRAQSQSPYNFALAELQLSGMDALQILQDTKLQNYAPIFAIHLPPEQLTQDIQDRAGHLGCAQIFQSPVNLTQLGTLAQTLVNEQDQQNPFFGTGRITKRHTSTRIVNQDGPATSATHRNDTLSPLTDSYRRNTGTETDRYTRSTSRADLYSGRYQRRPSQGGGGGTIRVRRGVTGSTPKEQDATLPHQTPSAPSLPAADIYAVRCAHCQGTFSVQRRSEMYDVLCVHCSQVNRIMPPE